MNDPHILYYLPHRTKKGASALKHKNNAVLAANRIKIIEKMREAAISVLPIVVIVLLLCLTIAPVGNDLLLCFMIGTIFVIAGMGMFSLGAEDSVLEDVLLPAVEEFPPPPQPATVRIMDAAMTAARAFKREFLTVFCRTTACF